MLIYYCFLASLALNCSESRGSEDLPFAPYSSLEDPLQFGFLKNEAIYNTCRIGLINGDKKSALAKIRLYKTYLTDVNRRKNFCCNELNDRCVIINNSNVLRWRLTPSNFFWGTECSLDDHTSGIFKVPLVIMKPTDVTRQPKDEESWGGMNNYFGGDPIIGDVAFFCWLFENEYYLKAPRRGKIPPAYAPIFERRGYEKKMGSMLFEGRMSRIGQCKLESLLTEKNISKFVFQSAPARGPFVGDGEWYRGTKGIYFDFAPHKDDKLITLFILYDNQHLKCSILDHRNVKGNMIEMWSCNKNCEDNHFENGTFDGENSLCRLVTGFPEHTFKGTIATDMTDPFYVFTRKDAYYFVTISGKIYVALPIPAVTEKGIAHLATELGSDSFAIREKVMRELLDIGKPAQQALESLLLKSDSQEQKRRLAQIIGELKHLPDRSTKLVWHDEKHPVDKLLFDQDKNKVYAFTKPNKEKQVYFFEIADKPQPRLFTGNTAPDAPASLPGSTRLFLEYARFVRKLK